MPEVALGGSRKVLDRARVEYVAFWRGSLPKVLESLVSSHGVDLR